MISHLTILESANAISEGRMKRYAVPGQWTVWIDEDRDIYYQSGAYIQRIHTKTSKLPVPPKP